MGGTDKDGYGVTSRSGGGLVKAHRLAWQFANGEPPADKMVLHTCDVRPCVNPAHLYLGTQRENMRDRAARGRTSAKSIEALRRASVATRWKKGTSGNPRGRRKV